jgi:hypothetical protein
LLLALVGHSSYSNLATSSWSELIGTWQTDSVASELPVQEPAPVVRLVATQRGRQGVQPDRGSIGTDAGPRENRQIVIASG